MRKYKLAVLIGRFQPFHNGHKAVLDHGLKIADKIAIFLGSAGSARTIDNPFNILERQFMIAESYRGLVPDVLPRIEFHPVEDRPYNDNYWMRHIQNEVNMYAIKDSEICLLGFKKDKATARYLEWFPQWTAEMPKQSVNLNATDIRKDYFSIRDIVIALMINKKNVPEQVYSFLENFQKKPEYNYVKTEYEFQFKHDQMWKAAPYPPMFITVDSVVLCSGHVLLIKRRAHPGKGLWALPGGYLNKDERIQDGAIRELLEETKIKVPEDALRGSIEDVQVFDAPKRSTRGRIVTHAHMIKLKNGTLPKIKGADDAEKAIWIPFADIKRDEMFEDHFSIIETMIGRLNGTGRKS